MEEKDEETKEIEIKDENNLIIDNNSISKENNNDDNNNGNRNNTQAIPSHATSDSKNKQK